MVTVRMFVGGAVGLVVLLAGCSGGGDGSGGDGPSGAVVGSSLEAQRSARAGTASVATPGDPRAVEVIERSGLALSDEQRPCVITRLSADAELLAALGDDPSRSERFGELTAIASECIRMTTFAREWADNLQDQSGGALSPEQLACLRDGFAAWTGDEVNELIRAGLDQATAPGSAGERVDALLSKCGVDRTALGVP